MSKEEALKAFVQMLSAIDKDNWLFVGTINPQMVEWAIKALKGADRPQGEWIVQEDDYHHYWECSECGMGVGLDDIRNFCPNCGAHMKGADDEPMLIVSVTGREEYDGNDNDS